MIKARVYNILGLGLYIGSIAVAVSANVGMLYVFVMLPLMISGVVAVKVGNAYYDQAIERNKK